MLVGVLPGDDRVMEVFTRSDMLQAAPHYATNTHCTCCCVIVTIFTFPWFLFLFKTVADAKQILILKAEKHVEQILPEVELK